jgi:predicted nucleotide-binding protein
LYESGVEIPSDYDGVIYVPLDRGWQLNLAKEIKAAGIEIDLNRAV